MAGEGMFADGTEEDLGAGFKKGNASQQSTGIEGALKGIGDFMGGAAQFALAMKKLSVPEAAAAATSETDAAPAEEAQTEYSTDGYGGSPGASGEGVYGRPSCARCRAYKAAHPETELINIDEAANRTEMWAALRARGFKGTSAALPVAVTADSYTLSAK